MRYEQVSTCAPLWVLAMGVAGFTANVTSIPSLIVVIGLAVMPPILLLLWFTRAPAQPVGRRMR